MNNINEEVKFCVFLNTIDFWTKFIEDHEFYFNNLKNRIYSDNDTKEQNE